MSLKRIQLAGFKSFPQPVTLDFSSPISAIIGPNGSGKSNVTDGMRFALGEQSIKSMRGSSGEDMIFNGGNTGRKLNRATVSLTFANHFKDQKVFNVPFEEVVLERTVYRDGQSEYFINGKVVRRKDVKELIAASAIAVKHHIISQGQTDAFLRASNQERREIIEDALGLEGDLLTIAESKQKLARVSAELNEVKKQLREEEQVVKKLAVEVERRQKIKALASEVATLVVTKKRTVKVEIEETTAALEESKDKAATATDTFKEELKKARAALKESQHVDAAESQKELQIELDKLLQTVTAQKQVLRELETKELSLIKDIKGYQKDLENLQNNKIFIQYAEAVTLSKAINDDDANAIKAAAKPLDKVVKNQTAYVDAESKKLNKAEAEAGAEIEAVKEQMVKVKKELQETESEYKKALHKIIEHEKSVPDQVTTAIALRDLEHNHDLQTEQFKNEQRSLETTLQSLTTVETYLKEVWQKVSPLLQTTPEAGDEIENAENIIREKMAVLGTLLPLPESATERMYQEKVDRAEFLRNEASDIQSTIQNIEATLAKMIADVKTRYKKGLELVNKELANLVSHTFGGGTATLQPTRENEVEGLAITISIPRKKVTNLSMLSGGEKTLVSLATVFAIARVQAPPFIVLDETDAALDEENSRRYSELMKEMSKQTQVIVVTHNRVTMAAADTLYGVTMAGDGRSRLLSVSFNEVLETGSVRVPAA